MQTTITYEPGDLVTAEDVLDAGPAAASEIKLISKEGTVWKAEAMEFIPSEDVDDWCWPAYEVGDILEVEEKYLRPLWYEF